MPASFGLVPELANRIKDKIKIQAYQERSTKAMHGFKKIRFLF